MSIQRIAQIYVPHEMTFAEFAEVAAVHTLQNHPQRYRVYVDARDYGFSNAATPDAALADVHHREINNALYFHLPEVESNGLPLPSFPPANVVAQYPDLLETYADILEKASMARCQEPSHSTLPARIEVPKLDFVKLDSYRVAVADYALSEREAIRAIVTRDGGKFTVNCYHLRDGSCIDTSSKNCEKLGEAKTVADGFFERIWRRHEMIEKVEAQKAQPHEARDVGVTKRPSTGMGL